MGVNKVQSPKDTALRRALRVLGYQLVVVVVGFLAAPNTVSALRETFPGLSGLFLLGAPILSGIYNVLLRSDVKNT